MYADLTSPVLLDSAVSIRAPTGPVKITDCRFTSDSEEAVLADSLPPLLPSPLDQGSALGDVSGAPNGYAHLTNCPNPSSWYLGYMAMICGLAVKLTDSVVPITMSGLRFSFGPFSTMFSFPGGGMCLHLGVNFMHFSNISVPVLPAGGPGLDLHDIDCPQNSFPITIQQVLGAPGSALAIRRLAFTDGPGLQAYLQGINAMALALVGVDGPSTLVEDVRVSCPMSGSPGTYAVVLDQVFGHAVVRRLTVDSLSGGTAFAYLVGRPRTISRSPSGAREGGGGSRGSTHTEDASSHTLAEPTSSATAPRAVRCPPAV